MRDSKKLTDTWNLSNQKSISSRPTHQRTLGNYPTCEKCKDYKFTGKECPCKGESENWKH